MPLDLSPLVTLLGPDHVLTAPADLEPFVVDWRGSIRGRAAAVVRPGSTDQVVATVQWARAQGMALVPQGGNTGLCGGATPDGSGQQVILNLARMNKIRAMDPAGNTVIAEAGCVLADVQSAAADAHRLFPLSLAAEGSAQIGGLVSTNAGGTAVLRYGNMRDLVLGLEVVLPDGRIWNGLSTLRKDNTGYDLKQLFIGSEGTLGIVTAASLRLYPRPRTIVAAFAGVADLGRAVRLLRLLQDDFGDAVTTFEIQGDPALELVLKHVPGTTRPLDGVAPYYALIEVSLGARLAGVADGTGLGLVAALEAALASAANQDLILDATIARDATQARALWRLREEITSCERREGPSIKHDVSVPIATLPAFVDRASAEIQRAFPDAQLIVFGHLGDGSLHLNVIFPADAHPATDGRAARLYDLVHGLAVEHEGSFSAEHGIGSVKRNELGRFKDPLSLDLMARLKTSLDPAGLLNPGKLLP